MLLRNLMKLRPESSIFLAAALALSAAVACEPAESNDPPRPDAGFTGGIPGTTTTGGMPGTATIGMPGTSTTGGMPGTSTTGGMPGTSTTGGIPGTSTTGGMPGTSTTGGMPGTSTTGGMPGTSTTGGMMGGDAGVDAGATGGGTGGGTKVNIAGRATGCTSYGMEMNGKCGGFYCNVTKAEIMTHFPLTGKCNTATADQICSGMLTEYVGQCAEEALGATESNRTAMANCIKAKNGGEYASSSMECLNCFIDAAICATNNCLIDCLGVRKTPGCDACRTANNCNAMAPACAGLPNPF